MIIFYRLPSESPNMRKISIMLAETALPHIIRILEKQTDGKYPEEFAAINPNTTFPTIVDQDNGAVIFESSAILYYLAQKSNTLLPASLKDRGETMKWLVFEAANVGPVMGELYHYLLASHEEISEAHLQRYKDKLAHYCSMLDRQLASHDYLGGAYSIADIALFPWTVILEDMADIRLANYLHLASWAQRISRRPAVSTGQRQH